MKLSIAHLYPNLLNIYGDRGNILTIKQRCQWRDIEVEITEIDIEDQIDPDKYDFYFIGGGQDQQQITVAKRLQEVSKQIHEAVDTGAVILAICGGYQLLGHYYQPFDGDKLEGISVIDAYTVAGNTRFIGNVTIELDESFNIEPKTLVGFENHSGLTYLGKDIKPIGKTLTGNGNNGSDGQEGAVYKHVYGTYLHGSLLPKNPHFSDLLITQALSRKFGNVKLESIDDKIELNAHNKVINKKY
ncbi:MAG: type 1 glutamine amidotransferase [Vampirovibrionia bacterium]